MRKTRCDRLRNWATRRISRSSLCREGCASSRLQIWHDIVSKCVEEEKEGEKREREDSNNKFIEHASHTFSCTPLFFLVRLSRRRRGASRRVLRKLCQRKRRATFALAMLIVGVNKQFRRVRQSEMHKTWEAGKLTGSSSALKFAMAYVFRFQIAFIIIFFYFEI